jgi:hypothetical protein
MAYGDDAPHDPAAQVSSYLTPGEQLLWAGRPDPDVNFTAADAFVVPFSIMWCGFAVFWEATAVAGGAPLFFALWGIPFVLVGLYVAVGRFVYKKRRKRRTAYGLTRTRALVAVGSSSMSDAPLASAPISIKRSRDGRFVNVTFGQRSGWGAWGPSYANTGMEFLDWTTHPVGFFDVAQPEALLAALQQARSG